MKKLLFIILTLLFATELFSSCEPPAGPKVVYNTSVNEPSHGNYIAYYFSKEEGRFLYFYKTSYSCAITYPMPTKYQKDKNKVLHDLSYIPDEIPYFFNEDKSVFGYFIEHNFKCQFYNYKSIGIIQCVQSLKIMN